MSWLRKLGRSVKKITRVPGLKQVARAVPVLGTAVAAYEGISALDDLTGGNIGRALTGAQNSNNSPRWLLPPNANNLPMLRGGGLTASTAPPMGSTSGPGILPRGPGGKLQMPWSDPNIPAYLKQFSIDDAYLRTAVRAPRGYVVLRDAEGRPFGVNKKIAQSLRVWKPKKKPPISVRDWEALKRANRTVTKLKKVVKMSKAVSMPTTRRRTTTTKAA